MRKVILATLVAAAVLVVPAAALAVPAKAEASSIVTLRMPSELKRSFPAVYRVKAINLPRKTYGYAPRWLVAETIVGHIQGSMEKGIPARVHPQGARWDGGTWRVRYRVVTTRDGAYGKFVVSKASQRLEFNGYS